MTLPIGQSFIIIVVVAVITLLTRAIPFIIFTGKSETPDYIVYLGKVLPPAVIGMLIIYCLKNINLIVMPFGIPEIFSVFAVIILHLWKRNNLISILGGTILYMVLVQYVF